MLPGIHPQVVQGIFSERRVRSSEALGVLETATAAAAVLAADGALKTTDVQLGRLHLATGFGGRAYFTLFGAQSEVEAAVETVETLAGEGLLDQVVTPCPPRRARRESLPQALAPRPRLAKDR